MTVTTNSTVTGIERPVMFVGIHSYLNGNYTSTAAPNSERIYGGGTNTRAMRKLDLSGFFQARLIINVTTASTSANTPRTYVTYGTDGTTFAATLDTTGTNVASLAATGWADTGWFDIASAARNDNIWVCFVENGGDASVSSAVGLVEIMFR